MISVSSVIHPAPMPMMNRPPEIRSSVAASLASSSGFRSGSSVTPVATLSVVVTAAAAASVTYGSTTSKYFFGISPSVLSDGAFCVRSTGMIGCSGTHSESNPNSSARVASVTTSME